MRTWSNGDTYISKAVSLTVDNFRKVSSGTRSNQFLNFVIIVERDHHVLFERRLRKGAKHVINFSQNLNRLATQLPRLPGQVPLTSCESSNRWESYATDHLIKVFFLRPQAPAAGSLVILIDGNWYCSSRCESMLLRPTAGPMNLILTSLSVGMV